MNALTELEKQIGNDSKLTDAQRRRIANTINQAKKENYNLEFVAAVGRNAYVSETEHNKQLDQDAENAFQTISKFFHGGPELKRRILKKIIKTNTISDNEMLEAIKNSRAEMALEEQQRIERAKLAESERKKIMSLQNRAPEIFNKVFKVDPEAGHAQLAAFPTQEILEFQTKIQSKPRLYSQLLDNYSEAKRILAEEITKRENANPAKTGLRSKLRGFIS